MAEPETHPEVSAALNDGPQAAGMQPQDDTPDAVKRMTHEVDTDDMFVQGGE